MSYMGLATSMAYVYLYAANVIKSYGKCKTKGGLFCVVMILQNNNNTYPSHCNQYSGKNVIRSRRSYPPKVNKNSQ